MKSADVWPPGARVRVGADIEGRVLSVQLDVGRVSYRVVWWHDGKREVEWFEAFEVEAAEQDVLTSVGFRNGVAP